MAYDFDRLIDRRNTRSYKWDQGAKLFGDPDILPLWVADMDFLAPPAVREVLEKRAALGVYGYAVRTESYLASIVNWYRRRHGWTIEPGWITDSPSIVTSLSLAVELFTEPGGEVVLQSPVYYPFYDVILGNGRKVAKNPLVIRNNRFEMDYEHLESLFQGGAKLLLLCSPHNPGGRVWEREELLRLGELCLRYGVTVVSDEIHCDLALSGHKHIPFASLSPELADITMTCLAATKTFNLPGLHTSYVVTSNASLRRRLEHRIKTLSIHMASHFAQDAVEAAYNEGEPWLEEMLAYVEGNLEYAIGFLAEHLPEVKPLRPDGTYLLWVDCRGLNLDIKGLKELMFNRAKVAFSEGSVFGTEGEGWLRINLACPRSILEEALQRFCGAAVPQ
ncbi:MalY/PatB family protein [Paenibacillus mucilaginosus]|uniref:cysteine-S-conjugate beta-lyase n=1 Tax=Paenibacillus mucilaginosus (strain KNP414) TaxID=1036673 RepID=F8FIH0_PAEMK|nr:MalY/PatB family protein [Paenibacillus mucilaginosus]AEI44713.1 aminotransferase class I and II [Paenibacillus mucilaginosus KNP414]MCG7215640.1 pyridoxal phosphate-dependent aminotransferase [Paenibacillus mucilaginosus]WDM26262.1 pyridoxal phosphate-dependent aminotransferase [Paenibacillus mucilaginosus]